MAAGDDNSTLVARRFDYLRQQAEQDANAQKQQQAEGLQRQAAAHGRLGSGIYQKLQEQGANQIEAQKNQNIQGLEANRDTAQAQINEAETNRKFATSEREAGQGFSSAQNALQRAYGTSEREAGQGFQQGMLGQQQKFATGEREAGQGFQQGLLGQQQSFASKEREAGQGFQQGMLGQQQNFQQGILGQQQKFAGEQAMTQHGWDQETFDKQQAWQKELSGVQNSQFMQSLAQAKDQFGQQIELDTMIANFNKQMAQDQFNKPGMLDGLFRIGGVDPKTGGKFSGGIPALGNMAMGGAAGGFMGAGASQAIGGAPGAQQAAGGASVLCTEFQKMGRLELPLVIAAQKYRAQNLSLDDYRNYRAWADIVAPHVRKSAVLRFILWPIVRLWSYECGHRMGLVGKSPGGGCLGFYLILKMSNILGQSIRRFKKIRSQAHLIAIGE